MRNILIHDLDPQSILPHFSTKLYRSQYSYLRSVGKAEIFDLACIELGMSKDFLLADDNWVSASFNQKFANLLTIKSGDPELFRKIGHYLVSPEIINPVEYELLRQVSALVVLSNFKSYVEKINLYCKIQVARRGLGKFTINVSVDEPNLLGSDIILNFHGSLEGIGRFYELPMFEVRKSESKDCRSVDFYIEFSALGYYLKNIVKILAVIGSSFLMAYFFYGLQENIAIGFIAGIFALFAGALFLLSKARAILAAVESQNYTYYHSSRQKNDNLQRAVEIVNKSKTEANLLAHDIRSPLSVLNLTLPSIESNASEEQLQLIKQALNRVNDIADSVLKKKNFPISEHPSVAVIVNSVLEEKKLIASKSNHEIRIEVIDKSLGFVCKAISPSDLSRMISNLINNSIEAMVKSGRITVDLRLVDNTINIEIKDTGKGIAADVLSKVGNKGFSFQKNSLTSGSGNGLGVYYAKTYTESVGGKFKIESKLGEGTVVSISLS